MKKLVNTRVTTKHTRFVGEALLLAAAIALFFTCRKFACRIQSKSFYQGFAIAIAGFAFVATLMFLFFILELKDLHLIINDIARANSLIVIKAQKMVIDILVGYLLVEAFRLAQSMLHFKKGVNDE